jgi:hypothetical protein
MNGLDQVGCRYDDRHSLSVIQRHPLLAITCCNATTGLIWLSLVEKLDADIIKHSSC